MRLHAFVFPAALMVAGGLSAQSFTTAPCHGDDSEGHGWFSGNQTKVCELRRTTLPAAGQVRVEGSNGSIEVVGEERGDIALEARVEAQASSREKAESIVREVTVKTGGTIEADGPKQMGWGSGGWSVSYKLRVPKHLAARLVTHNGAVSVANLDGRIEAETTNGGVALKDLAGDVHASTVNGGVEVRLLGARWQGTGLVVKSTNGGVSVKAPENYSAHLVADTTNGGVSVGFPMSDQGKHHNHVDTNIGQGGPTLQFETVNGGVSVGKD